jgi:hypothetical protein
MQPMLVEGASMHAIGGFSTLADGVAFIAVGIATC